MASRIRGGLTWALAGLAGALLVFVLIGPSPATPSAAQTIQAASTRPTVRTTVPVTTPPPTSPPPTEPPPTTPPPTAPASTTPVTTPATPPRTASRPTVPNRGASPSLPVAPYATVQPTTTVPPTTTTTIAAIGGNLPVAPSTLPLTTKGTNAHVNPLFAILSGIGFGVAVLIVVVRLLFTRRGSRDRRPQERPAH